MGYLQKKKLTEIVSTNKFCYKISNSTFIIERGELIVLNFRVHKVRTQM